jgi:hypothetical protein
MRTLPPLGASGLTKSKWVKVGWIFRLADQRERMVVDRRILGLGLAQRRGMRIGLRRRDETMSWLGRRLHMIGKEPAEARA